MDIETKIKKFIKYAKEVCLQNLFLADNIKVDLKNQDNLFEAERIEKEVISKYENIYLLLEEETLLNIYEKDKKIFEKIKETIEKMAKDSNLKEEYIKAQIKKREELKGNSGAEVVEKFFKYKIKELKKIKGDLLQKLNKLLNKEEKLNLDLSNAIQEVEQLEIIDKLQYSDIKYVKSIWRLLERSIVEILANDIGQQDRIANIYESCIRSYSFKGSKGNKYYYEAMYNCNSSLKRYVDEVEKLNIEKRVDLKKVIDYVKSLDVPELSAIWE